MTSIFENEDEEDEEEEERKLTYTVCTGTLGAGLLLLAAMLAVPKQEFDTNLAVASVAFATAIPLLALVSIFSYFGYTGRLVTIFVSISMFVFNIGMISIFNHFSDLASWAWGIMGVIAWVVFMIYISWPSLRNRINAFLRRGHRKRPQARPVIQLMAMPSETPRNRAQRTTHSYIVQREMKYHRPIERSRAGNHSDSVISRGSYEYKLGGRAEKH